MLFSIAGITGRVGGTAARHLLDKGHTLRAIVRDPAKASQWADKGVELIQGDWNDSAALLRGLQGVDGAYLMMPPIFTPSPDFSEARSVLASYRQALDQAAPPKLVLLSSFGSEQTEKLGLITSTMLMEQQIGDQSFPTAILRAGSFYENHVSALPGVAATGVFHSFYQPVDRPVLMIATEDIGAVVADLLTTTWSGKRILEIGTPFSPEDVAKAMGSALGRDVVAQAVPRDRWTATLESVGFPAGQTWGYEEMADSLNSGHIHHGIPGTEPVAATLTLEEFYRQQPKAA